MTMKLSASKCQKTTSLSYSNHCSVTIQCLANSIDAERSWHGEGKSGHMEPLASVIGVFLTSTSGSKLCIMADVGLLPTDRERSGKKHQKVLIYDWEQAKRWFPVLCHLYPYASIIY